MKDYECEACFQRMLFDILITLNSLFLKILRSVLLTLLFYTENRFLVFTYWTRLDDKTVEKI